MLTDLLELVWIFLVGFFVGATVTSFYARRLLQEQHEHAMCVLQEQHEHAIGIMRDPAWKQIMKDEEGNTHADV